MSRSRIRPVGSVTKSTGLEGSDAAVGGRLFGELPHLEGLTVIAGVALCGLAFAVPTGLRVVLFGSFFAVATMDLCAQRRLLSVVVPIEILVFGSCALASITWADTPARSLPFYMQSGAALATAGLLLSSHKSWQTRLVWILTALSVVLLLNVFIVVFRPSTGVAYTPYPGWRGLSRHKNVLAMLATCQVCVGVGLAKMTGNRWAWLLAGLGVFVVIETQSSTALLAAATAVAVALITGSVRWRRSIRALNWLIRFSTLPVMWALLRSPTTVDATSRTFGKTDGLTGRTHLWAAIGTYIDQRLLTGWGLGGVWQGGNHWQLASPGAKDSLSAALESALSWNVVTSHNMWVETALQLGIVGLALGLVVFVKGSRRLASASLREGSPVWWSLFVGLLVYSVSEAVLLNPLLLMLGTLALLAPAQPSILPPVAEGGEHVNRTLSSKNWVLYGQHPQLEGTVSAGRHALGPG